MQALCPPDHILLLLRRVQRNQKKKTTNQSTITYTSTITNKYSYNQHPNSINQPTNQHHKSSTNISLPPLCVFCAWFFVCSSDDFNQRTQKNNNNNKRTTSTAFLHQKTTTIYNTTTTTTIDINHHHHHHHTRHHKISGLLLLFLWFFVFKTYFWLSFSFTTIYYSLKSFEYSKHTTRNVQIVST